MYQQHYMVFEAFVPEATTEVTTGESAADHDSAKRLSMTRTPSN